MAVSDFERLLARARAILQEHDTEPTEAGMAFLACVYGAWLLLPFRALADPPFRVMLTVTGEDTWGLLALVCGLAVFGGLAWFCQPLRRVGDFGMACYWSFIAAGTALGNLDSPAWVVYSALTLGAAWSYIRATWRRGE